LRAHLHDERPIRFSTTAGNRGPVALITNVVLPVALIVLLRKPREAFT
jgi:hypothetical protein